MDRTGEVWALGTSRGLIPAYGWGLSHVSVILRVAVSTFNTVGDQKSTVLGAGV
jgi:hypothetical protein